MKDLSVIYIGKDTEMIQLFETSDSFKLVHFPNGLQAINWLTSFKFNTFDQTQKFEIIQIDLIVSESNLPGVDGFGFFQLLKKRCIDFSTPYILVTSNFKDSLRIEAFKMGIDGYMPKPLDTQTLVNRALYLINEKQKLKSVLQKEALELKPLIHSYKTKLIKRIFDLTVASIALLFASPIFLFTAIALKLESKGPIFYASKRVGSNFNIFNFYKFRSMYPDADKRLKEVAHLNQYKEAEVELFCSECAKLPEGEFCSSILYTDKERICERMVNIRKNAKKAFLKIPNDPRITKVGNFIRNSSIDELPQLVNVLKGDMSIVGNRPLPVGEANAITKSKWAERFNAAAGITGLWQVELRGQGGIMSEEERFKLDNKYAENNSFWGDIRLILRTFPALFQNEKV